MTCYYPYFNMKTAEQMKANAKGTFKMLRYILQFALTWFKHPPPTKTCQNLNSLWIPSN